MDLRAWVKNVTAVAFENFKHPIFLVFARESLFDLACEITTCLAKLGGDVVWFCQKEYFSEKGAQFYDGVFYLETDLSETKVSFTPKPQNGKTAQSELRIRILKTAFPND